MVSNYVEIQLVEKGGLSFRCFVCVLVMDSGNKFQKFSFGDNVHAAEGGGIDGDSPDEEDVFASVVGSICLATVATNGYRSSLTFNVTTCFIEVLLCADSVQLDMLL